MIDSRMVLPLLLVACTPADSNARNAAAATQEAQDSAATAVISPDGGTIELKGVAVVIFPAGAFEAPQEVRVSTTNAPQTEAGRVKWDVSVGPPAPMPYDVRINSGNLAPATSFEIVLTVPDSYLNTLPANRTPYVFAQIVSGGAMEDLDHYEVLDSDFDPAANMVRATVPLEAIRPPGPDGMFQIIVLVGTVRS